MAEELSRNNPGLTDLAKEWRGLLFPDASDEQFDDGYAQAVTFGLLVARVHDVDLSHGLNAAAEKLREQNTLIGAALRLLIDNKEVRDALSTSLDTLRRVLNAVSWKAIAKGDSGAWLYFYEDFLEVYDNDLRKKTGSYYTPPEVVEAMTRLVDEALRDPALFNRPKGLAAPSVTICDPAVGTGTFLLGVLRRIADTVKEDEGEGAVAGAIRAAADRIFGFELQFGPFAVAQLRLIAEVQSLTGKKNGARLPTPNLYVTDTLGNPYAKDAEFSSMVAAIGESRRKANQIKREQPITVVIGNPPYKEKARGRGGWIEKGGTFAKGATKLDAERRLPAAMDRWTKPDFGQGAHLKHLKNLYVYFWRWATLKVFGSGWYVATGEKYNGEQKDDPTRNGIVCFITVAGFINGPGFQKMREDLRRDCSDIWVVDCSPEGHQPEVSTRIFQGVQQPVCIVLAARTPNKNRATPARLHFRVLPGGHREREKFTALAKISLHTKDWIAGPSGWFEPFLPEQANAWTNFPRLEDLFAYNGSGVMAGRTWVIAPDKQTLKRRWEELKLEKDTKKKEMLFHPQLREGELGSGLIT